MNSVGFTQIGGLPSVSLKSNESSVLLSASYWLWEISGNWSKCTILATSVFGCSAGGWNLFIARLMGGHPGTLNWGPSGKAERDDVCRLTGLFNSSPEDTLGAPGDDSPCSGICSGGTLETCHNHLVGGNILASVAHNLDIVGLSGWLVVNLVSYEMENFDNTVELVEMTALKVGNHTLVPDNIGVFPKSTVFAIGSS